MLVMEMSNKKQQIPAIRFNGFTDAWEQRKLGDVGSVAMNRRIFKEQTTEKGDIPFYKIGTFGGKPDAFIPRALFEEYKSKYPYPEIGDILISASGSIGRTVEYTGKEEYFQDSNIVWVRHEGRIDNKFLKQFYSIVEWKGLEGSTIQRLYNKSILDTTINLPSIEEQKKIGVFFQQVDDTIALHQRQLNDYKQLKKSMLQKMFPQDGEKVPKIRFDGFTKEWEQRKLGDCFAERNERMSEGELISVTINSGVVKASSLDRKDNSSEDKSNYKKVEIGDIAYNSMRMWQGASGVSRYSGILSPAYTVIVPKKQISSVFFSYLFKLNKMIQTFQANSQGLTSDTWNLKYPVLKDIKVYVPNYEEQNKIGNFFKQLDDTIAFHQQKVNDYQQVKKALLQQMLV